MTIPNIIYLSLYYALACPLETPATPYIRLTCSECWWNLINIRRHDLEEIPCHSSFSAADKKLTSTYIQCKHVFVAHDYAPI